MKIRLLISTIMMLVVALFSVSAQASAQSDTPPYLDPTLSAEERTADLLARMSLDEKIGQMTLVEKGSIQPPEVAKWYIGGILSGGGGYPTGNNTPEGWLEMVSSYQEQALQTPLAIPMIYGVDAVHGHNNVKGAVVFPHNIGLGATRNAELVEKIGQVTAQEMIATGIYWDYAPVVAVPHDIRWGRNYEGYSENTEVVTTLATAFVRGLQGEKLSDPFSVLATPKHFIGDGGTAWETSTTENYKLDQGVTEVDEATLRELYLPPYQSVIENGAQSIMISYSSWGGMKMHAQQYLITDVLKGELGFSGFIVSDWAGMDQITSDYYTAMVTGINAGVDMNMVPYNYPQFISTVQKAVANGDISMERIDDAVSRILKVKFEMGLFERPTGDADLLAQFGSDEHRAVARQAVNESLVLLQNKGQTLPLAKDTPVIFVAGTGADNIGRQSGGWTIEWQGVDGDIGSGTSFLDAVKQTVSADTQIYYNQYSKFDDVVDASGNPLIADVGIVVVAEHPYAEGRGDNAFLKLDRGDMNAVTKMRDQAKKLVIVLYSGRPVVITDDLELSDAYIAAWLPGTEGNGVTDVLFGDQP
ncbi:MAG TPA: glycoside hydrolase family 3 protein, partial [Phototrophicaceae bacterium]|nr:glycoside hydrolase family 3 protein [Phototrophicaceae bacterium]